MSVVITAVASPAPPNSDATVIANSQLVPPAATMATALATMSIPSAAGTVATMPIPASGNAAVVFKAKVDGTDQALRFFIKEDASSSDRYNAIAAHFTAQGLLDCVASTVWVDDAIAVNQRRWPMVQMEWIEGRTLDAYIGHLAENADVGALHRLAGQWRAYIRRLQDAEYAQAAIDLLRNESMRCYRIEVAADSMVELDEQAEKESRLEFIGAAGSFLEKAVQAAQVAPELIPLMGELLMFGVRSYKASRPIEAAFEQAMQKMSQPQQPKPDPEQIKLQGQMQIEQAKWQASMQADNAKLQATAQIEQMKAQFKAQSESSQRAYEGQLEQARMQMQAQVDDNRQRSEAEQHALKIQNEAQLAQLKAQFADQAHER